MIRIKNLSYSWIQGGVLDNISLSIVNGECISILGPSGCGKSTLLNIIAGQIQLQKGEIYFQGTLISGRNSNFAYMPQEDLLLPWYNALDNACLPLLIKGISKNIARQKALELFPAFGLGGNESKNPSQLSGGMRQRVAFLRTVLCEAKVFLLDEPFGALDAITRTQMQQWLLSLKKELGLTIILVTHDIEEAIFLSDNIYILNGSPAKISLPINIPTPSSERSRIWLSNQTELRNNLYDNYSF